MYKQWFIPVSGWQLEAPSIFMSVPPEKGHMSGCVIAMRIVCHLTLALGVKNQGNNEAVTESV